MLAKKLAALTPLIAAACASSHPLSVKLKVEEQQMKQVWTLEKDGESFKLGPYAIDKVRPTLEPNQIGPVMLQIQRDGRKLRAGGSIVAKPDGGLWSVSGLIAFQDITTSTVSEPSVLELKPTPNRQLTGTLKHGGATYTIESAPKVRNALGEDVGIDAIVFQENGKIIAAAAIDRADVQLMMRPELAPETQEAIVTVSSALLLRRAVVASSGMATKDVKLPDAPDNIRGEQEIFEDYHKVKHEEVPGSNLPN